MAAALSDDLIGLRNSIRVSLIVTLAAWENPESRGCHYREDSYPQAKTATSPEAANVKLSGGLQ